MRRDDQEFLPAALSIIETPPSPTRLKLSMTICALIVGALVWSWFGRFDVIAEAQGKFQPTGRVKVVQPVDTGRVANILVSNGVHVEAGDVLVELDADDAKADAEAAHAGLAAYEGEVARRQAAIAAATTTDFAPPPITWPSETTVLIRSREEQVLKGDLAQLNSTVDDFQAQSVQKEAERNRLQATIAAQEKLIEIQKERVDMRETLVANSSGTKKDLIDAAESMAYQQTQLEMQKGQLAEAIANLSVISVEKKKSIDAFVSDNSQKLADAAKQADDYRQRLAKAQVRLEYTAIKSPVAGVVMASSVVSRGQVIVAGDEIMRIVPDDSNLEIECYLPNSDVGFVKPGQTAEVKIESFPFIRYGTIQAKVVRVAHDAIPEPDATQAEGAPEKAAKSTAFAGTQRIQNLVYSVTLKPLAKTIRADGEDAPLVAGMAATVEIRTGSRRILEYIFSPLVEVASDSMKER
jgi:hemolysin D